MNRNTKILITIMVLIGAFGVTSVVYSHNMNKKLAVIAEQKKSFKKVSKAQKKEEKEIKE